jgi:cytosine/adenosine deaminase-related metal-dependent hydrolase
MARAAADKPLHVHLSEQPAENHAAQMFYGRTPTELLDETGLLSPRTTAVHATHVSDRDIKLLGAARVTACFCPTTERDLADGIGPARPLRDAGSRLALGSDQHAVIDPFEELRGLEMHERLASNERGRFTAGELVEAASAAGYASLGWDDGGRIADGALADFVVVRTDTVNTAGTRAGQAIYCATKDDIDHVFVGGEEVVRHGHHRIGHVARLLSEALDLVRGRA